RTDAPPDPEPETVPRRGARRAVRDERGRPPGGGGLWDRLRRRDKNGNGTIERDEVPDRMSRFFERADTNGDGSIDAAEMRAVAQRRRGGRGRGRRERQPDAVKAPPAVSGEADTAASPTAEAMGHPSETASPTAEAMGHPSGEGGANAKPADAKTAGAETAGAEAVNARAAGEPAAAPRDDPISGEWTADMDIEGMGGDRPQFFMTLKLAAGGAVSGSYSSQMSDGDATSGRFDKETGRLTLVFDTGRFVLDTTATVRGDTMSGNVDVGDGMFSFDFTAKRTKSAAGEVAAAAADAPPAGADAEPAFTFKPLTELLPGPRWVSSIETSHAQAGRVYVTFDGHRSNDDEPHVFVSENNGETWRSIRANLPASAGSTRVIREDIKNPDILYLGTEFGLWVSLDRGARWSKLNGNLPTVAVHEVAIHPTAGEIVVATHGRSLWVLDVTPLREITRAVVDEAVHLFAPRSGIHWRRQPPRGGDGGRRFVGENPASGAQVYYALKDDAGDVNLEITDLSGKTIRKLDGPSERGLHRVAWNLRRDPDPRRNRRGRRGRGGRFGRRGRLVPAGTYRVALTVDGERFTRDVIVETDPDHPDYHPWEREYEDVAFELFMGAEEDADGSPDVTDPGGL
ncbi:MAG: hypothetical protein ACE5E6_04940, partial [Phycisphaerae bacterium]